MTDREILKKELTGPFFQFCTEIGFSENYFESDNSGSTEIYAINTHALCLSIDWRDCYLDIEVVRLINGTIPKEYSETSDGRLCRIPIRHIYGIELPIEMKKNNRQDMRMQQSLLFLISVVQRNPEILQDYIMNIDANTSPENTKEYKVRCLQCIIDDLDKDFKSGKIESKMYQVLRRRAVAQMNAYIDQCC